MKTLKLFLAALVLLVVCSTLASNSANAQYLGKVDTLASNSANDTSKTYTNPYNYGDISIVVLQNNKVASWHLVFNAPQTIRVRYVAADSSLYTDVLTVLGWAPCGIIITGTTTEVLKYPCSLKTGNALIAARKD